MSTGPNFPALPSNVLGGYGGNYIYGVLSIPNSLTGNSVSSACNASGDSCPLVYHCGRGEYQDSSAICNPGFWGFASADSHRNVSCSLPYYQGTGAYTDASPTPYNWMAGLNKPGAIISALEMPSINNLYYPHLIPINATPATGLNNNMFADFVDGTNRQMPPVEDCSQGADMVVAYDARWFTAGNLGSLETGSNIAAFMNDARWKNGGAGAFDVTSSFTYNGLVIPNIKFQIYNFILTGSTANFCGQTSTLPCTNGEAACSNYYATVPAGTNPCQDVLSTMFGSSSSAGYQQGVVDNSFAKSYTDSSSQYCTNAVYQNPDSAQNTGPAECFCVNPEYSSLYVQLNQAQNPALEKLPLGCWWNPCGNYKTALPTVPQWNQTCDTPICATIIANTGGTITNQGQISQYVQCQGSSGPSPPGGNGDGFHWITIVAVVIVIVIVLLLVFFIARRRSAEQDEDAKVEKKTVPEKIVPTKPVPVKAVPVKPVPVKAVPTKPIPGTPK